MVNIQKAIENAGDFPELKKSLPVAATTFLKKKSGDFP
jgi:hypothetical protein